MDIFSAAAGVVQVWPLTHVCVFTEHLPRTLLSSHCDQSYNVFEVKTESDYSLRLKLYFTHSMSDVKRLKHSESVFNSAGNQLWIHWHSAILTGYKQTPDWPCGPDFWLAQEPIIGPCGQWRCCDAFREQTTIKTSECLPVTQCRLLDPELADISSLPPAPPRVPPRGVLGLRGLSDLDWLINGLDGSQLVRLQKRRLLV